jgi:hypothetical protein
MPQTKSKNRTTSRSGATNTGAKSGASTRAQGSQQGGGQMLEKFLYDSLKDIYWAEKHLLKALPRLSKAATNEELINALDEHLEVTEEQVARLEQVFELLGKKAQGKKCEAMEGLTKERRTEHPHAMSV